MNKKSSDDDFVKMEGKNILDQSNRDQKDRSECDTDDQTVDYRNAGSSPAPMSASSTQNTRPVTSFVESTSELPKRVGRYAISKLLGRGGFGEVYLGLDDQLRREVAIKLTFGSRVGPMVVKSFLAEAQMLAELDHPNIVPVYDIGTTDRGDIFIVSKLIDGTDLATRIEQDRPSRDVSLEVVIAIADALHYAHSKGVIHRDVKPANILLDRANKPYLADFGIALRETDETQISEIAGTPAYMSPEQARGEGHLMTNQSDIYSLGVVFYELLSGRRPFRANSANELIRMIQTTEIRTPRVFDASISRELERVCLKALARRPSDRFAIAKDFADEVRYLLSRHLDTDQSKSDTHSATSGDPKALRSDRVLITRNIDPRQASRELSSISQVHSDLHSSTVQVIPKGLRSFDENDSEFFLDLLPGPFDRTGLPEAIGFWKKRIENTELETSFRVGLVYGPSGCGKSSLMKAGLLPRLSNKTLSIYIEATPEGTTDKLEREIRKRIPEACGTSLADTLSIIRRRKLVPSGGKILLVLDQFEQWLHAHKNFADEELTNALRQCDGVTIQTIIMVRDDFWLSVSRFLRELDIPIVERENSALVDLFSLDHAKKVLALFGKAYEKIPEDQSAWTKEQKEFLQKAVEGLSQEERVISVRLALFAEMMKSKTWTPKTLVDLGGIAGVGVTFLEETFGEKNSPIQFRQHLEGVRLLLGSLLPAIGTNIKGHSRPQADLQKIVGYENQPKEFSELVSLLDKNLRLITPSDEVNQSASESRSYQLTHDYLVPSLRQWLNQKQRETQKGRAELKLAERAATWEVNPENKQLPSFWEWVSIRRLTDEKKWSDGEQRLMRSSKRYHLARLGTLIASICIIGLLGVWGGNRIVTQRRKDAAIATVESWLKLDANKLSGMLPKLHEQTRWIKDEFGRVVKDPSLPPDQLSRALIGLEIISDINIDQWALVNQTMFAQSIEEFLALCKLLKDSEEQLKISFKTTLDSQKSTQEERLLSAAGLAMYDPDCETMRSDLIGNLIADGIAKSNPIHLKAWQGAFQPIAKRVIPFLQDRFADTNLPEVQRNLVATVLSDYAKNDSDKLAELISLADVANYRAFLPSIRSLGSKGITSLVDLTSRELIPQWNDPSLDPNWKEVDSTTKLVFEQARGLITNRFAYTQAMPLTKFLEVAEALRNSGYRPTRVRPWSWYSNSATEKLQFIDLPMVAAVFIRDGKKWQIESNLKKEDIPQGDKPASKGDLVLDDLCTLSDGDMHTPRYLALWSEALSEKDVRRVLIDVDIDKLMTEDKKIRETSGAIRISVSNISGTRRYNLIYSSHFSRTFMAYTYQGGQLLYRPQMDIATSKPGKINLSAKETAEKNVAKLDSLSEFDRNAVISDPIQLDNYARSLLTIGDYKRTQELCDAGLKLKPESSELKLSRFIALVRLKQSEKAKEELSGVLPLLSRPSMHAYAKMQYCYLTEGKQAALSMIGRYRQDYIADPGELYNVICGAALCASAATEVEAKDFIDYALDILESDLPNRTRYAEELASDLDLIALHSSPRFLAVINQINDSCSYVGAWDTDTTRETLVVPEEPNHPSNGWINQTRVTELVSQGWRPSAIALGNRGLDSDSNLAYGSIVFSRPLIPAEQIESHAKKQANTLIALYELGEREKVWRLLDNCITDARVRSYFQAYLTQYGADPEAIVQEFLSTAHDAGVGGKVSNVTTSTKLSTAILAISLGDFQQAKMLDQRQHALVRSHALKLFVEDVDSGVHSSCEWLLKQLGAHEELRAANQVLSTGDVLGNRNWYRTKTSDDTFVLLGPTEYVMGSPIFEKERYGGVNNTDEAKHRRKINYRFAIGSKETTIEQFQRFRAKHSFNRDFSKESDAPANRITWFDAVAYCNFLSSCEGIKSDQFCYEINPTDPRDIVVPPDILSRTGYRLPTEAEWEYACRAGSTTARPYGETKELLGRFAWFADNSGTDRAIPVGTLRPNDFGLFDMLGNIFEWNQEGPYGYTYDSPYSVVGRLQSGKINPEQPRILRGGSFVYLGSYIRSSRRFKDGPAVDNNGCGFRISRSYR